MNPFYLALLSFVSYQSFAGEPPICFDYVYHNRGHYYFFSEPVTDVGEFAGRQARYCYEYESPTVHYVYSKDKSSHYEELINKTLIENPAAGVDARLIKSIIQIESAFNETAVSKKGAQGLMQLMPSTALRFGVKDSFNPSQNIRGGVVYFNKLMKQFNGDLTLALAAYNAGEKAVTRYGGIPPYKETQEYVKKVLAVYHGSL